MFVSICQPLVLNYSLITVTQQKRNWQCLRFSSLGIMILKKKEICLQILLSFFVKYLRSNIRHGKKLIFKLETHCKTHQQKNSDEVFRADFKYTHFFHPISAFLFYFSAAFKFHFASVFHLPIYFSNHLRKNSRDEKRILKILCVLFS